MSNEMLVGITVAALVLAVVNLLMRVQRLEDDLADLTARHEATLGILRDNLKPRGSAPPRPIPHQEQEF